MKRKIFSATSISVAIEIPTQPLNQVTDIDLGIDLGLKTLIYDSDGYKFDNIKKFMEDD